jgi:hypothetical protein
MVRRSVETMKLANTPVGDVASPSDRMRTQTVAASSKTMKAAQRGTEAFAARVTTRQLCPCAR